MIYLSFVLKYEKKSFLQSEVKDNSLNLVNVLENDWRLKSSNEYSSQISQPRLKATEK